MIQTLWYMIRRFCAYVLEFKDQDGFTHYWCTLIPASEFAYKKAVHFSTAQTPAMLEKRWTAELPVDTLKWDKSHKVTDLKVGRLVLVSISNYNNIKGPNKLKHSYVGPFVFLSLHGTNSVQLELSGKLENRHPTFPVSLIKPYQQADKKNFFKKPKSCNCTTSGTD
ncbi:hypothetical protein O181_066952 [Austropuccinia psidii MF-1]|uniref:Tf2-1-like SH3-like domain-containing protein n=1 Tax=Austropuccinia psidii MF-1 TaxID=1389203 RepID=A0A9Q3EZX0_9BASI|nr:hypothetical protein [Austropuccinia psidii MF-1]